MGIRHIYEEQEYAVVALLTVGKPKGSKATFVFTLDGKDHERIDGQIVADKGAPAGKAATCKTKAPVVAADKPSHLIKYHVEVDGEKYTNRDEIHVWPKKGKLEVVKKEDGTTAFPDFKFEVIQNGARSFGEYVTKGNPAVVEFKLKKEHGFELKGILPCEMEAPEKKGTALRDLKAKGVFTPEFVKPKIPGDKKIKQWVNLDTAKSGQDGLGPKIVLQVGIKGDRDETGKTKPDAIGKAGMFVFVKVEFGPAGGLKKSKRNSPKTELLAGKNLSARVEKTALTEYTGKVELKLAGGVGELEIHVGFAGGDTCKVSIGCTDACDQDSVEFTNWRRVYYELLAPDFMPLVEKNLPDGTKVKDLPAGLTAEMDSLANDTFTEFVVDKSHTFATNKAPTGTVLPRTFIGRGAGPANVYILTDHTFTKMPTGTAFDNGKAPRVVPLKLCDDNLYAEGADHNAPKHYAPKVEAVACRVDLPANVYWLPVSGFDGTDSIRELKWKADVTYAAHKAKPKLTITFDGTAIDSGSARTRVYDVTETVQHKSRRVTFSRIVGDVATTLSDSEKTALKTWFNGLLGDVAGLRKNGLQITIKGDRGAGNKIARSNAIDAELKALILTARDIPTHPGLMDDGTARSGDLKFGTTDRASVIDMARSTKSSIAVNLPNAADGDPGKFVGAASDTKCPIELSVKFTGHHGGLGLAQGGKILTVLNKDHPKSSAKIVIHELGHLMNLSGHDVAADANSPGLPKRKNVTENLDIDAYKDNGSKGHTYVGKGHSGPHCAYGLSDADKADGRNKYDIAAARAKCVMFGSASFDDATVGLRKLCVECAEFARARDVARLG